MPMYNLLAYSQSYSMASGRLWNYYRDEIDDVDVDDNASDSKPFEYIKKAEETLERPPKPKNP